MSPEERKELYSERAKAGVRHLDQNIIDWRNRVELSKLDMLNVRTCVLGQLYGDWVFGIYALKADSVEHGFSLIEEFADSEERASAYAVLTEAWLEQLKPFRELKASE